MQGKNPGIWIAAALVLAALIVAVSVPRRPSPVANSPAPAGEKASGSDGAKPVATSPPTPAQRSATPGAQPGATAPMVAPGIVSAPAAAPTPRAAIPPPSAPAPEELLPTAVSRTEAVQALDNVHFALRDYRAALGGNPVGTNQEITAALLGDNAKQVRLDLPDGSRTNGKGEMCDPWGTPYFFHQVSAEKMEIRSAGPDRVMWTSDDVEM